MNRNYTIYLAILCWLCTLRPATAQIMWPGDINDNGIVNTVDLLYLGAAYGTAGPPRAGGTPEWTPQPVTTPWGQSFPNGINYAFADCDGNGIVNDDDLDDGVEDNFGLTHGALLPDGYANAPPGAAPRIELIPSATLVEEGATVTIDLVLGTNDFPVADFYGIALAYSYTTALLADDDGLELQSESASWINPDASLLLEIQQDDEDTGAGQWAVTRTNQQTISGGAGKIASFSIVVEDIIVGLSIDTFQLSIDSVLLINHNLSVTPVTPDTARIVIAKDSSLVTTSLYEPAAVDWQVYPNPAVGEFFVKSDHPLERIRLLDSQGRPAPHRTTAFRENQYRISVGDLPAGLYCLTAETDGRIRSQRIFLQPKY